MTAAGPDSAHDDERPPPRASVARSVFYAVSVAIILWAGAVVPLPLVETVPGNPTQIPPLIEFEGIEATTLDGSTALLTVQQRQQPTLSAFGALIDPTRSLRRVEDVYPPGIDRETFRQLQLDQFGRQFDIAAAVGAQAAGIEAEVITEVVVVDVVEGSPADGLITPGDVVVRADGQELAAAEELQTITHAASPGDELTLTIRHAGREREVVAQLGEVGGADGVRLGVVIETVVDELRLPFDIRLTSETRIGGPSAGLMVGLTVHDLLSDEDLLQGRTVVGTGTLSSNGLVGPVGGVPEKLRAATEYGADLILVPDSQLDAAMATAPDEVTVIGVGSLDEAIEVLRREPV